ncbi:MAG: non-canonical purine NTP pyrophosphatase [marine bacterium B5-7]|nr:MAG: non-canonical purine NTP pyrophosphatase [marine bacterium B5-7]
MTQRVVIASNNAGKIREFNRILEPSGLDCIPQGAFNIPEVPEDGLSFVENAIIKARHASRYADLPAIADDSGLEVEALNSAPGIYSARFAGPHATDADNSQRLLKVLADTPDDARDARFICVIVYMRHAKDPVPIICTGTWRGSILRSPRGSNGFGYDPVFKVAGTESSAAELSAEVKNTLSHRAKALSCLMEALSAV